jgi:hypothetical protein
VTSKDARWQNIEEAILLLMDNLCGRSILEEFIDERSRDDRILPRTWEELTNRGLVRRTSTRYIYTLSGIGWIAGLKLREEFDTDELKSMTGRFCAALKDKVKGRQDEAMALVTELALDSDLPESFIRVIIYLTDHGNQRILNSWTALERSNKR